MEGRNRNVDFVLEVAEHAKRDIYEYLIIVSRKYNSEGNVF